jgi:ABC-type multidrug transport system fused ATPase/permease subunit
MKTIFLSLFLPYKKITEENYYKKDDKEDKFVTIVMRIVGAVLRVGVLIIGGFALILNIFFGTVAFLVWILLPIISTVLMIFGVVALLR